MREYSGLQTMTANTPYAAMLVLGAATIGASFGFSPWAATGAGAFVVYGIAGALWIMVFVCPYCAYHGTNGCPCGYGRLSAKFVPKGDRECFAPKFKKHIAAIVPLWLIPMIGGGMALWRSFSWSVAVLMAAFAVNSYVILPLVSRRHSCAECPQKDDCPWMGRKASAA